MFGSGHEPGKLIGIPLDRSGSFDVLAIVGNGRDLRDVVIAKALLNCQSVPGFVSVLCAPTVTGVRTLLSQ